MERLRWSPEAREAWARKLPLVSPRPAPRYTWLPCARNGRGLRGRLQRGMHCAGYGASKGGLIALTRELAAKWAPHNIRVNAIAPGFFATRMTEGVLPRMEEDLRENVPMGRPGREGEIKGVAVFLAS